MYNPDDNEVGTEGLGDAELPQVDPQLFTIHVRKAAQVLVEAMKQALVVPGNPRATAKLRGKYCSQLAVALREAATRI
jgi:hypothetical protein